MITFKQFLTEAANYPLYHGTTIAYLEDILKNNELKTGWADKDLHWPSKDGSIVSLTRNLEFAKKWKGAGVVIELNRRSLSNNYRIVPFNYFGKDMAFPGDSPKARWSHNKRYIKDFNLDRNQYEEAVTKNIKPLKKHIVMIHIFNKNLTAFDLGFLDNYDVPYKVYSR